MVSFRGFATYYSQLFDDVAQLRGPTSRQNALIDHAPVSQKSDTIPRVQRELRQTESRVHSAIKLAISLTAGTHQAPAVQNQPHRLAALDAKGFGHRPAASTSCRPADV